MIKKYTDGPWVCGTNSGPLNLSNHARIFMSGAAGAAVYSMGCDKEEDEANAKLIASSPDLLSALQAMLDDGRGGHNQKCEAYLGKPCTCAYGKALAAIKKATE